MTRTMMTTENENFPTTSPQAADLIERLYDERDYLRRGLQSIANGGHDAAACRRAYAVLDGEWAPLGDEWNV